MTDWSRLIDAQVHPVQVATVEALEWVQEPISAVVMTSVLGNEYELSNVAYHCRKLFDLGVIEVACQHPRRGSTETCYRLVTR